MTNEVNNLPSVVAIPTYIVDDGSSRFKIGYLNSEGEPVVTELETRLVDKVIRGIGGYSKFDFKVGDKAFSYKPSEQNTIKTNNRDFQTSVASRVMLHAALRKLDAPSKVDIIVTVPIGDYFTENGDVNESYCLRKIKSLKDTIEYMDGSKPIVINSVEVLPEGAPALLNVMDEMGFDQKGRTLAIDIGGTTSDVATYSDGVPSKHYTARMGAFDILYGFKPLAVEVMSAELGGKDDVPDSNLEAWLQDGLDDVNSDFHKLAVACVEAFTDALKKDLMENIGSLSLYDRVVISGGGSLYLKPSAFGSNCKRSAEPNFDNVKGVMKARGMM